MGTKNAKEEKKTTNINRHGERVKRIEKQREQNNLTKEKG